jgi:hypothetical protein
MEVSANAVIRANDRITEAIGKMKRYPLHPRHPERICWGCDRFCPAGDLRCGNGTVRTMHPVELFGDDWAEWAAEQPAGSDIQSAGVPPKDGTACAR